MSAFVRSERIQKSTPEIDQAELQWWNEHAPLIERIWGLPESICNEARRPYLHEVRKHFREGFKSDSVLNILEVACGSGWPGRLLADEKTHVTGIDFSSEQIRIAKTKASLSKEPGAKYCSYLQSNVSELSTLIQSGKYNGVFIHCGLHHLSFEELVRFVDDLEKVPKGFKVILVEPMYHDKAVGLGRICNIFAEVMWRIYKALLTTKKMDESIAKQTTELFKLATEKGWFLSPKEMPFTHSEIQSLFAQKFITKRIEPVTHFGLRLAIHLATLEDVHHSERLGLKWLPVLNRIDRHLIRIGLMPALSRDYFFTQLEFVKK